MDSSVQSGHPDDLESLTGRMASSDEDAYRLFFDRYFDRLLRYHVVLNQGNEAAAKDSLQATLLRVVRHIKPFAEEEVFWDWLALLSRCAVRDQARKSGRHFDAIKRYFENLLGTYSDDSEDDFERMEDLDEAIIRLPERDREIIHRKYRLGQSVRQMARELETTEKAIESKLLRARHKLKTILTATSHER